MNKTELIAQVAEKTGLSKKDSELAVNASLETITETLIQGEKVQLVGFGAFDVKERGVRMGRNPRPRRRSRSPLPAFPSSRPARLSRKLSIRSKLFPEELPDAGRLFAFIIRRSRYDS